MEKKRPAVVRFAEGAHNNYVGDVKVGRMGGDGIVFEGESTSNKVSSFTVGISELSLAIDSAKAELERIGIDEAIKKEIIAKINDLGKAEDKETRFEKYKSLIDLADKHIKILGPLYEGLKSLWDLF
ncbi:hypothetical protein ACI2J7_01445 [Serratia bockelmannii]|uniref:hypothetical protein n=1 Tax=Serratia bockelmannii TaxID=2703793 RepID=UPI00384DFD1F